MTPRKEVERTVTLRARVAVPEGVTPPEYVAAAGEYSGGGGYRGADWTPDESETVPIEWAWDELRYRFVVSSRDFLPIVREVDRTPGTTATREC